MENKIKLEVGTEALNKALVIHSAELIQKQLELIEKKIFVQVVYGRGFWCYILHRLPSDKDVAFAASGECQDGDLWLDADMINTEWYLQEQKSFLEALENGINEALSQYCA